MGGLGECRLDGLCHLFACRVWVGPDVDVVVAFKEFGPKVLPRGGSGYGDGRPSALFEDHGVEFAFANVHFGCRVGHGGHVVDGACVPGRGQIFGVVVGFAVVRE